nr:putative disease resistance RPP13-like protein 3 [Ipomoea batatas]
MAAFGAVTILMDTLHQNFLQPTPLFPLRNKKKVSFLYRNLSSLQTSLEEDFGFKLGEYDEAIKGLEAQLRDVSVELRFQIEHQLRLFYLGKSMKLRLRSAQKLLPILNGAIKGGKESMDFNSVKEILGKHFTLPVSGMPPHIYKRVESFCSHHQLYEQEFRCPIMRPFGIPEIYGIPGIPYFISFVSSQIKKKVKSWFRRLRKSDEAERRRYMLLLLNEAESVIRQELRASYLNKYMKQRILATQRIRQLLIQGISLTSNIKKEMLKVKNADHRSNNSQNNNPASLRGLELDNITELEVDQYSSCEPLDIWGLPQLKNISICTCGATITLVPPKSVHHNLESIRNLDSRSCTKELFLRIPNLRKLSVTTDDRIKCKAPNWFESLVYLYKVEVLVVFHSELREFSTIYSKGMLSLENFWPNLKRLYLSNTHLKWRDMDVVGKLSELEDLTLGWNVKDRKWKPKDGGFRRLKFLYLFQSSLQYWEATSNHFPVLEKLKINDTKLKEIPSGFAEITTLKSIKLYYCLESLISSAERIQKEQHEYGNDTFVLDIIR